MTPKTLDQIRARNGKTEPTTAHEIIMCPVFRLGFVDFHQKRFLEEWEWRAVITAMGLSDQVLGSGIWSYERGQAFAQACPDATISALGEVRADTFHPLVRRLDRCMCDKDVL